MLQNQEFIQEFVDEAMAHVKNAELRLLKMQEAPGSDDDINNIFRAVHSIKGTAIFFGLKNVVDLAHAMETVFGEVRNGKLSISDNMTDILLCALDCLRTMISDVFNSENTDISGHRNSLSAILAGSVPEKLGNDLPLKQAAQPIEAETGKISLPVNEVKKAVSVKMEDSIRVNVSLLNDLLNLASELVLGRNQLLRSMEHHKKKIAGMESILQNVDHITTQLQGKILQTRMQPISNIFNKFPRLIHDLSKKVEKEIELSIEGAHVELDKSIIEALGDPLTHLIRNAIDHGLEAPQIRENKGKLRRGLIELKAYHEGGYVNIDVIDDGAGINIGKIRTKALGKGIVSPHLIEGMNEQDIIQLIFKPGFSTAENVTDVSGRGVGMDVVKTNIEKLGGLVEIYTTAGSGCTFRLVLPLTLAIISSLIVEAGGQRFAIPQVKIQEMVRIRREDSIRKVEYIHNAEVFRLKDRLLPIVHLSKVLELKDESAVKEEHSLLDIKKILVLKTGQKKFGLIVDRIYDKEEILVKPLPKHLKDCICYSGVTILGDGKTAMILEPEGIITKENLKFTDEAGSEIEKNSEVSMKLVDNLQSFLTFKCSGSETFAVDLTIVSKVQKISLTDIENINDKEYIKFNGKPLRVIRPESYLPVSTCRNEKKWLYIIIPRHVKHPIGILATQINDTIQANIELDSEEIKGKGLMGTAILQNKIVLFINIYELFEKADPEHYAHNSSDRDYAEGTVLLVEDTPFFARMEKNYLEMAGYKVILAGNGKEALDILDSSKVDLIVSDIQMPVMDGFELVKQVRQDKRLQSIPMIAVTSMSGETNKKRCLEMGFNFYELKLDRTSFLEKVEKALKSGRGVL